MGRGYIDYVGARCRVDLNESECIAEALGNLISKQVKGCDGLDQLVLRYGLHAPMLKLHVNDTGLENVMDIAKMLECTLVFFMQRVKRLRQLKVLRGKLTQSVSLISL
jgi:hypothetical protein